MQRFLLAFTIIICWFQEGQPEANYHSLNRNDKGPAVIVCYNERAWVIDSIYYYTGDDQSWDLESRYMVRTRDEFGNPEDALTEFYFTDGSWSNKYLYKISYLNDSTRDQYLRNVWNSSKEIWLDESFVQYIQDGRFTENYNKEYDFDNNLFFKGTRQLSELNSAGLIEKRMLQKWNQLDNKWVNAWQYFYYYNAKDLLEKTFSQSWNSTAVSWQNERQDIFFFNNEDNVAEQIIQFRNINNLWENRYRYQNSYDASNNLILRISQEYSNEDAVWRNQGKSFFVYDEHGRILQQESMLWYHATSEYVYNNLIQYNYNAFGSLDQYNFSAWDNESQKWVYRDQEIYTYSATGKETSHLFQQWDRSSDAWSNIKLILNYYDQFDNNIRVVQQLWDPLSFKWDNDYRRDYFIGLNHNYLGKKVKVCHKGKTIWISVNAVPAHLAHGDCLGACYPNEELDDDEGWSEGNNEDDEGKEDDDDRLWKNPSIKIYPNPVRNRIKIEIRNNNGTYQYVELVNSHGIVCRSKDLEKYVTHIEFSRGNLKRGIYFVKFSGKEHFVKKIFIK